MSADCAGGVPLNTSFTPRGVCCACQPSAFTPASGSFAQPKVDHGRHQQSGREWFQAHGRRLDYHPLGQEEGLCARHYGSL